jgi:hypothetical protein
MTDSNHEPADLRRNTADKLDMLALQIAAMSKHNGKVPAWLAVCGAIVVLIGALATLGLITAEPATRTQLALKADKRAVDELDRTKTVELEAVRTDIAVIKTRVESVDKAQQEILREVRSIKRPR